VIPGAGGKGLGLASWSRSDTKYTVGQPVFNADLEKWAFFDSPWSALLQMRFIAVLVILWFVIGSLAYSWVWSTNGISRSTYDELVRYTKYSSGAYHVVCFKPLGNHLVQSFTELITDTQGFIARDDIRKELVVAFRGSQQVANVFTDAEIMLVPFESPGVNDPGGAYVHMGFLAAYNSVADNVLSVVEKQLEIHPGYSIVSTGHSLGAAIASISGLSLKANFPNATVKMYTFGQPRTGNFGYATLVEEIIGRSNIFRGASPGHGRCSMKIIRA